MAKFSKALERWNERFSNEGYLFGQQVNHYLAAQKDRLHGGKALAIADGEGRNSVWLAQQNLEVEAFDFSPVAIEVLSICSTSSIFVKSRPLYPVNPGSSV